MSLQEKIEAIVAIDDNAERKAARKELISSLSRPELKEARKIFKSLAAQAQARRRAKRQAGRKPQLTKEQRIAMREARKKKKEAKKADPEKSDSSSLDEDSTGTDTEDEVEGDRTKPEGEARGGGGDESGRDSEIAGPDRG